MTRPLTCCCKWNGLECRRVGDTGDCIGRVLTGDNGGCCARRIARQTRCHELTIPTACRLLAYTSPTRGSSAPRWLGRVPGLKLETVAMRLR